MKRLIITSVCALFIGLIIGGIAGWFIGYDSAKPEEPETTELDIIAQSLDDGFWSNGVESTQANATQAASAETQTSMVRGTHKYVLNGGTMKIHKPDCKSVKDIQPENYSETDDFIGSLAAGYSQCKNCYPYE